MKHLQELIENIKQYEQLGRTEEAYDNWLILLGQIKQLSAEQKIEALNIASRLVMVFLEQNLLDKGKAIQKEIDTMSQPGLMEYFRDLPEHALSKFYLSIGDAYANAKNYGSALTHYFEADKLNNSLHKDIEKRLLRIEIEYFFQVISSWFTQSIISNQVKNFDKEKLRPYFDALFKMANALASQEKWASVNELYSIFKPVLDRYIELYDEKLHHINQKNESLSSFTEAASNILSCAQSLIAHQQYNTALAMLTIVHKYTRVNAGKVGSQYDATTLIVLRNQVNKYLLGERNPSAFKYESLSVAIKKELNKIRSQLQSSARENLESAQEKFVKSTNGIIRDFLKNLNDFLGLPPCPFSVISLGSFSNKMLAPYSDLDCAFLITDSAYEKSEYFQSFIRLMNFGFTLLGECDPPGLRIDSGTLAHLLQAKDFIKTPRKLANLFDPNYIEVAQPEPYALHRPSLMYSSTGAEILVDLYLAELASKFNPALSKKLGFHYLKEHQRQWSKINLNMEIDSVDIKNHYLSPLLLWITDIALYYCIYSIEIPVIIKDLEALDRIDRDFLKELKRAIYDLQYWRIQSHALSGFQNDVIFTNPTVPKKTNRLILSSKDAERLQEINTNLLQVIYKNTTSYALHKNSFNPYLESVHFDVHDIKHHINIYYYNQSEKATRVLTAVKNNPLLWTNARNPITINIICALFQATKSDDIERRAGSLSSTSKLHEEMEIILLKKAYDIAAETTNKDQQVTWLFLYEHFKLPRKQLAAIAFKAFIDNESVITLDHINKALESAGVQPPDFQKHIDILTHLGPLKLFNNKYEFINSSFHEYYVGQHMSEQYASTLFKDNGNDLAPEIKHAVSRMKLNPLYQGQLCSLAATFKNNPKQFALLLTHLKKVQPDKMGHYELGLIIRCVEEVLDAPWTSVERKCILTPIIIEVQRRFEKHYSMRDYRPCSSEVKRVPYFIEMLRISPCWQRLSGDEDIYYGFSDPYYTNARKALLSYIKRMGIVTPRVTSWLIYYLWSDKASYRTGGTYVTKTNLEGSDTWDIVYGPNDTWSHLYPLNHECLETIISLGKSAAVQPEILAALMRGFRDSEQSYWRSCRDALVKLNVGANQAFIVAIIAGMRDQNYLYRENCIRTLVEMGAAAASAEIIAELELGVENSNRDISRLSTYALKRIRTVEDAPKEIDTTKKNVVKSATNHALATAAELSECISQLYNQDEQVRLSSLKKLPFFGLMAATPEVITRLIELCSEKSGWTEYFGVERAISALDALSENNAAIINAPRLISLFSLFRQDPMKNSLKELFIKWTKIYLKNNHSLENEGDLSLLLALFVGGYLAFNVSLTIGWNNKEGPACYTLQGYVDQDFYMLRISPKQAQFVQHYSPEIIMLLDRCAWPSLNLSAIGPSMVVSALRMIGLQRSLPSPDRDPLLSVIHKKLEKLD